jgi:tetratricopeptide (TPR) repeat protein
MMYLPTLRSLVFLLLGITALAACSRKLDPRVQEGYDLVVAGRVDDAIALANSMLAEDPDDAPAYNLLGLAHYKVKRLDEAAEQYLLALESDPGYAEAHFNLGNCYQMQGKVKEAESSFAAAVREEGAFVPARYNLGKIYEKSGRTDQAIEEYKKCVEYDNQYTLGFIDLGRLFYDQGNLDAAIEALTRALELEPSLKEVRVLLGNAYMQSSLEQNLRLAENEYRASVGIDPDYVDGLYSLGVSLASQGRHVEAIEWFEQVLDLLEGEEDSPMFKMVHQYFEQVSHTPNKKAAG